MSRETNERDGDAGPSEPDRGEGSDEHDRGSGPDRSRAAGRGAPGRGAPGSGTAGSSAMDDSAMDDSATDDSATDSRASASAGASDSAGAPDAAPVADGRPVGEIIELTPPGDVAREALNRARAAARAKGLYPGAQRRRILAEPPRSGPGKDGRDPKLFAETLAALLQQRGWVQEVSVGGVIGRWREVVGADIADHCTPETFEDHALVVRADSTAWATQIRLLVPSLLAIMEREVGQDVVQSITVLGPVGPGFGKGPRSVRGRGVRDTYG